MGNGLVTVLNLCPNDTPFHTALHQFSVSPHARRFDELYEVDMGSVLGEGKFSKVVMGRIRSTEQRLAIKLISLEDEASRRVTEEIVILRTLRGHPGVVQLIDCDVDEEELAEAPSGSVRQIRMALELCEGGELYERIQRRGRYPQEEAKVLVANLLDALAFIHAKGIMHRDLKLENILLCSKLSYTDAKISDFGLARTAPDFPRRLPRSTSICGSDFYLSPEVIRQEEYGREVDVWALGVIFYVLVSGQLPFYSKVLHKLYRQILERDLDMEEPVEVWGGVSQGCRDLLNRLLQARPGDRVTADQARAHPWLRNTRLADPGTSVSFGENHTHLTPAGGVLLQNGRY